jgi:alanyl-tRNA synthetase
MRFDFSHPEKMTPEQIKRVEDMVNEIIQKDLPMSFIQLPKDEAFAQGALGAFGEKYPDIVKVYTVGDPNGEYYSKEICGGPHVTHTGEIGKFKIVKEESSSAGVRRIKATIE